MKWVFGWLVGSKGKALLKVSKRDETRRDEIKRSRERERQGEVLDFQKVLVLKNFTRTLPTSLFGSREKKKRAGGGGKVLKRNDSL